MIRSFLTRFFPPPPGGTTEVSLSHEGISIQFALIIVVVLGLLSAFLYYKAAPDLSLFRRGILTGLRTLLIGLFVLLFVEPVLMLTLNEPVREKLLVVIDTTQSMGIKDRRHIEDDKKRAAIAAGLIAPKDGLKAAVPDNMDKWRDASRSDLLAALAGNEQMNLWPRLQEKADLEFFRFGRDAQPLGKMGNPDDENSHITLGDAKSFFDKIKYDVPETAIGDSLHQILDDNRGQPISGVLVITDGANNSGVAPEEVAQIARQDGVPLYLYGIGITAPKDIIVHDLSGPRGAFAKERAEFTVKVRGSGFAGTTVKVHLKADGKEVDTQDVTLSDDDIDCKLGYVPETKGEVTVEASVNPLDEESATDNNVSTTKIRVLDSKIKVLYLEGEPRWDFRYLLSTLQRDRRLNVKCVIFDGDPDLSLDPDSPFLREFPQDRSEVVSNEIIIIGDVDPQVLGTARMKLINEWVSDMGGGLIFLAGTKHNPFQYAGTPLEPLLPVELNTGMTEEQWSVRSRTPIPLKMTPTGEYSTLLNLAPKPEDNRRIWKSFPGVRWTARVSRARPTAQVFLVDSRPEMANRDDLMPVIAQQPYGQGMVMYFGFDETYRWRSQVGEKYYIQIWNQVMQSFSLERQLGASSRVQLKVEHPEYLTGDKVVISGKIYSDKFAPLTDPSVAGTFEIVTPDGKTQKVDTRLTSDPDAPGEYELEYIPVVAGEYHFTTSLDSKAVIKFDVLSPKIEMGDTAMNASLLQNLAQISGGKFLREEDLNGLPDLVASHSATIPKFQTVKLYYSVWWMVALMVVAATEWLLRRLWQLK